jgi:hypothetical protein
MSKRLELDAANKRVMLVASVTDTLRRRVMLDDRGAAAYCPTR